MTVSVHNPDQYMASLRQIIAQGRKRIGHFVGAGAPAGISPPESDKPLIPAVAGLTDMVMDALKAEYGKTLDAVRAELETHRWAVSAQMAAHVWEAQRLV